MTKINRVGIGLLVAGIFSLTASIAMSDGNVMYALFWGWRVLFQAGALGICLGLGTIILDPETTTEIGVVTGFGVLGQFSLSVTVLITGGEYSSVVYPLFGSVVPLLPMGIGYMVGALRTVSNLSENRRLRITAIGEGLGFVVWISGYLFIVTGYDTTGEGLHRGFLFTTYVLLLIVNIVVGGFMYALWRRFGSAPPGATDETGQHLKSTTMEQH